MQKANAYILGTLVLSIGAAVGFSTSLNAEPGRPPGPPPERRDDRPGDDRFGDDRFEGRPGEGRPGEGRRGGDRPRYGRPGRPPRLEGPSLEDMTDILNLTPQQQQKIKAILEDSQKQIDGTLTPDQRDQLKEFRNRRPGRGGPGGPRGPRDDAWRPGPPPMEDEDHGRPVEDIARDLGVTPEQFREAFKKVRPAGPGERPTQAQRQANRKALSEALGVSPEKLDEVMDKYRPGGRGDNGPDAR